MDFLSLFDQPYDQALEAQLLSEASLLPSLVKTLVLIDVSGSMELPNGNYSRLQHAASLSIEAKQRGASIWATSGSDVQGIHATDQLHYSGYLLWRAIERACKDFGGGGIFCEQAIQHISHYEVKPQHLIILTDGQNSYIPTWGKKITILNMGESYVKPY